MNFEKLKELKSWASDLRKFGVSEGNEIIVLIDEAIARQSATSEEVSEAIEWQVSLKDYHQNKWGKTEPEWQQEPGAQSQHNEMMKAIDLAIAALQAYEPTTRKDRTVEEVAISKTEITSEPCSECRLYQRFVLGDGVK